MKWIAIGYTTFAIAILGAWQLAPRIDAVELPVDRMMLALQLCAAPAFVLLCILQGLWRIRETPEAEDPFANKESRGFKINQRVMTNTVEQLLMFAPIFIALAIRMDPASTYWLPILVTLWCTARLMFWVGYRRGLHYRAPGMDWTIGTTAVTMVMFLVTLL